MGQSIEDGTGKGNKARVDAEGRLFVLADTISHLLHHSLTHQNLFLVPFCVTLPDSGETQLAFFKNVDSDITFEFYLTQYNADEDCVFKFRFGDAYSSGGVAVDPINMYLGSGVSLSTGRAQIYEGGDSGDMVLNTGDGRQWYRQKIAGLSAAKIDFDGGLIIPNGRSASVTAQGTAGTEVAMIALCSYHDIGVTL